MSDRMRRRRRHRRMTVGIEVEYAAPLGSGRARATTLGAGGLFIATDHPLPTGSRLVVAFALPGGAQRHRIASRVVWRQLPGDDPGRTAGMGIAFRDPAAAGALAVELEAISAEA